jgi:steroid 5-alpha reductase family enzyme
VTTAVLLASAGVLAGLMVLVWLASLPLRNASIVDIAWGSAFVLVAWTAFVVGEGSDDRRTLLAVLVTVWGLRLTLYLAWRNGVRHEDYRYAAMRRRNPERFPTRSLVTVFLLQGVLAWIVSLPVQLAAAGDDPDGLGALAAVGVVLWVVGFLFEAVGDAQLARFKADPGNAGTVMDRGLWRYTRHPNYFGDFCVWWGIFLVAAEAPLARIGVVGPVVMSILLMRVSGVPLLERSLTKRRAGYAEYVARTSAFFPRPPRPPTAGASVPSGEGGAGGA